MSKQVLHLRSSFEPGGTETLLLNLFNYVQDDFDIHFVLLKKGSLVDQLRPQKGNRVYHWYRKNFLDIKVLKKLHKLVNEEGITIIHTHQFIELSYAVLLKMLNPRIKLVHQIHLLFSSKNVFFYLERTLSQRFARVITVSNAAKSELVDSFGFAEKNIHVLHNAVYLSDNLKDAPSPDKLKVPLRHDRINVVMIANFVWGKDHETLFRAYDTFIRQALPQVNFYFIGAEGEISAALKQKYVTSDDLANGRIVFAGRISNASALLPLFDIVVMSCFSETFNLALVEAAATGKVVLASDIAVFRELSENGKYFHHFKTADPRDLFEALEYLVKNLPEVSGRVNAEYFRMKYGFDNFVRSLDTVYTNL
jgi:glycosyltransferase involved in cell wall biosynthesis